jgi:hypothetical protein
MSYLDLPRGALRADEPRMGALRDTAESSQLAECGSVAQALSQGPRALWVATVKVRVGFDAVREVLVGIPQRPNPVEVGPLR